TQLTGRAGRRGIDVEGHAVVLWQPGVDPRHVGGLASTRTYPLKSSFRPGYNMAINLVGQFGADQARELLEQSFAQFQADRAVVGTAKRIERNKEALAGYAEAVSGDFDEMLSYVELRKKISDREKYLAKQNSQHRRAEAARSLEKLRKGDVILVPSGRRSGLAVVIDPGLDPLRDPRPVVVTEDRWSGPLSAADFPSPVEPLGRVKLPKHVELRSPKVRRDIASSLRNAGIEKPSGQRRRSESGDDPELLELRHQMRQHPVHGMADREANLRWVERYQRLAAETQQLERRVAATTHSLARSFDRICALLAERGYLERAADSRLAGEQGSDTGAGSEDGADADRVTEDGMMLARIYSESDLLAAECVRRHVWHGLSAPELAAVVSSLVYEARRDAMSEPKLPQGAVPKAWQETVTIWSELTEDERRHRLDRTREPDAGF